MPTLPTPGSSSSSAPLASARLEVGDDPLALYELSLAEGFGDGLPVLPPTEARVRELLAATPHPPDHVVADLPPRGGAASVEKVAVNAALAGVSPDAFPYVLAAVEAVSRPDHNLVGLTTTTSSVVSMLVVNGPRRAELGFDHGAGCLGGAGGRGSSTVGRALQLCLRNIGGQVVGDTSRTVFGQPGRSSGVCFAEWEERSPWPTLAERLGHDRQDEVVTAHAAKGVHSFADGNTADVGDLLTLVGRTIAYPLSNAFHGPADRGQTLVLVQPLWAERFAAAFADLAELQACLHAAAWQPIELWPESGRALLEQRGRVDADGRVRLHATPEQLVPVVCGGLGNLHCIVLPTWGETVMQAGAVLRPA